MNQPSKREVSYVIWQNRASRFYLAARLLYFNELYAPAAYAAAISIELLLKATLIYWDQSFIPKNVNHNVTKLLHITRNKVRGAKDFAIPNYFYFNQRYINLSRYPKDNGGLILPGSFRDDLDKVFIDLILFVPFQHNTELKRALSGGNRSALSALRYGNRQMQRLHRSLMTGSSTVHGQP